MSSIIVRELKGVREIIVPPRKVIKEGSNYKLYLPRRLVRMYDLAGKRVEVVIRITE